MRSPKLLVAEDDTAMREALQMQLTRAGFDVTAVDNGADAVIAATEQEFDLALLDLVMPGLNGIQAARMLRRIKPGLPLVALTAYAADYGAQAAALGLTCLSKPMPMEALVRELRAALPPGAWPAQA